MDAGLAKVEEKLHQAAALVHDLPFDRRFRAVSLASLVHALFYFTANHAPLGEPRLLEPTGLDRAMPFIPATVLIYVSAYALVFVAFLSLRRVENGTRFLAVFLSCVVVAGFIHWAMPTRFPRELFPLTADADPLSAFVLSAVRAVDTPSSCLPSLHVATSMAAAMLVHRERPKLSWGLLAWAVAIAVSTLTTKQHYLVDVVTGTALAVVAMALVDVVNALRGRRVRGRRSARRHRSPRPARRPSPGSSTPASPSSP